MSDRTRLRAFLALCLARLREYLPRARGALLGLRLPGPALGRARGGLPRPAARALAGRRAARARGRARVLPALRGAPLVRGRGGGGGGGRARRCAWGGRTSWSSAPGRPRRRRSSTGSTPRGPRRASPARASTTRCSARPAGVDPRAEPRASRSSEPGGRYVDFLVPGLIGMNLMSAGMWGVGYVLVDMRIKKLLKRLLATPMRAADFMAALMATRVAVHVRRGRRRSSASPGSRSACPCAARSRR